MLTLTSANTATFGFFRGIDGTPGTGNTMNPIDSVLYTRSTLLPSPTQIPTGTPAMLSTTLSGYTQATFTTTAQTAFVNAVSTVFGVAATAVNITGVTTSSRRHLLTGVTVAYTVTSKMSASMLTSVSTQQLQTAINIQFANNGLTVPTVGAVTSPSMAPTSPASTTTGTFLAACVAVLIALAL